MLRHACGYYLGAKSGKETVSLRKIQRYLGHANIQNTELYTALAPNAFEGLFTDDGS